MHWLPASLPAWLPAWLPACLPCLPGGLPDCLTASLPPARSLLLPSIRFFSLRRRIRGANSPPRTSRSLSDTPRSLSPLCTISHACARAAASFLFPLAWIRPSCVLSLCRSSAIHVRPLSRSYTRRPCPRSAGSHPLSRDLLPPRSLQPIFPQRLSLTQHPFFQNYSCLFVSRRDLYCRISVSYLDCSNGMISPCGATRILSVSLFSSFLSRPRSLCILYVAAIFRVSFRGIVSQGGRTLVNAQYHSVAHPLWSIPTFGLQPHL